MRRDEKLQYEKTVWGKGKRPNMRALEEPVIKYRSNTEVSVLTSSLLSAAQHSSFAMQGHSTLPSWSTGPVITVCHIPLDTLLIQVGEVSAEDEHSPLLVTSAGVDIICHML